MSMSDLLRWLPAPSGAISSSCSIFPMLLELRVTPLGWKRPADEGTEHKREQHPTGVEDQEMSVAGEGMAVQVKHRLTDQRASRRRRGKSGSRFRKATP